MTNSKVQRNCRTQLDSLYVSLWNSHKPHHYSHNVALVITYWIQSISVMLSVFARWRCDIPGGSMCLDAKDKHVKGSLDVEPGIRMVSMNAVPAPAWMRFQHWTHRMVTNHRRYRSPILAINSSQRCIMNRVFSDTWHTGRQCAGGQSGWRIFESKCMLRDG